MIDCVGLINALIEEWKHVKNTPVSENTAYFFLKSWVCSMGPTLNVLISP